jgi:hypothetical protein
LRLVHLGGQHQRKHANATRRFTRTTHPAAVASAADGVENQGFSDKN